MSFYNTGKFSFFAILALTLVVQGTLATGCSQKQQLQPVSEKASSSAVILFLVGDVRINSRKASVGEMIQSGDRVELGKRSTCDIQLREPHSGLMVRLTDSSRFTFSARKIKEMGRVELKLDQGEAMVDVKKLAQDQKVRLVAPAAVAAVRGTRFSMQVKSDGSATTRVYEGSVATRVRVPEIEELPPGVIESSRALTSTINGLEQAEQVLEKGKQTTITREQSRKVLASNPELEKALRQKAVQDLRNTDSIEDPAAIEAARKIDQSLEESDQTPEQIQEKVKSVPELKQNTESISDPEMKRKLEEYKELISVETEKLKDEAAAKKAVEERNRKNRGELQKRIEKIFNKKSETLILRGGERIHGVVYQEGTSYIVLTVEGKKVIPGDRVEGFSF